MKINITNSLIFLSIVFTIYGYYDDNIYLYGINSYFLNLGKYFDVLLQFFLYSFIHSGVVHFIGNALFLYIFGTSLEKYIGPKKYFLFFLIVTIFSGISLILFTKNSTTFGISGFCMALLSYYTILYKLKNNSEYKGGITGIIILIGVGFGSNISLIGHLSGAILGVTYFYLLKLISKENE